MKETIMENNYYTLSIDTDKNRAYFIARGEWGDVSIMREYVKYSKEAVDRLTRGFTVLADVREMTMPADEKLQEILPYFVETTKYNDEAGIKKQAQIVKEDTKEVSKTARKVMKDSNFDEKMIQFTDPVEAEKWLDM